MFIQDRQFSCYSEDCFFTKNWQEIFENRRVLVCSLTRFSQTFIKAYIRHIEIYAELYKLLGIDQVYFITKNSPWVLLNAGTRTRTLETLGDVDNNFIRQLAEQQNITSRDVNFLSRYWNFQVLINNGQVERIDQQPIDSYFKQFIQETKRIDILQHLGPKNEHYLWSPTFLKFSPFNGIVYYWRLHPNTDLKKYLFDTHNKQ
jgi:peroxiredoxin